MKKLKKSPQSGDEVAYLTALVKLMIKEDIKLGRYGAGAAAAGATSDRTLARQLPVISEEFTSSLSTGLKVKEREEAEALWQIEDDDYFVELYEKYVGEIFYDEDDEATFKVVDVQYDERGETSYYEATCVEVTRGGGGWEIPEGALVDPDSDVIKDADLVGYALVNLTDPENIINYDDVDKMIGCCGSDFIASFQNCAETLCCRCRIRHRLKRSRAQPIRDLIFFIVVTAA